MDVDRVLRTVALRASGVDRGTVASWATAPLAHRVENLTTAKLERVHGQLADRTPWTVVAKTLQPASSSPSFVLIPEEHHSQVLEDLRWLNEPDVYRCGVGDQLPAPLRMPVVYAIDAGAPDSVTIWMEHVDDVCPWTLARYRRTAEALGMLGGRLCSNEAQTTFGLRPRDISRMFFGKILHHDVPLQSGDEFWESPEIAAVVDPRHRDDLDRLAAAMPRLLERLERVPRGLCHGDATPDNFREPVEGEMVLLDWSYAHVGELGSDLAQLLVGRFDTGAAAADDVEPIAHTIFDGYCAGLARSDMVVDPALIETSWAVHLAIRSIFSALLLDHRPDLDGHERLDLLETRARVARYGLDLALRVAHA